jgi:hypothetical protein
MLLVGTFPFNGFLAGILGSLGFFALTGGPPRAPPQRPASVAAPGAAAAAAASRPLQPPA